MKSGTSPILLKVITHQICGPIHVIMLVIASILGDKLGVKGSCSRATQGFYRQLHEDTSMMIKYAHYEQNNDD